MSTARRAETGAPESISKLLRRLTRSRVAGQPPPAQLTIGELVDSLDSRAYGLVLLVLAAPNLTPGPSIPGFSTVLALPLLLAAAQLALGYPRPWMPARIARMHVSRRRVRTLIARALPAIVRVEAILRPRLRVLAGPAAARLIGLGTLALGALLAVPIPIYSMLPALAVAFVALGLLAHDGFAIVLGAIVGVGAAATLVLLIWLARAAFGV
ncbi:MAG TPA: exopolysaccharide biosynthesis protein [Alphaproteobacteria bacterium]|nr:exopolysaccharide biosynthesis protein [Alphaproteobacteria bacterium]